MCACLRPALASGARAPHVSHTERQSGQKMHPRQPVPAHRNRWKNKQEHGARDMFRTAAAAALAQEKTAQSIAGLPAMSAYRQNLLSGGHFGCRGMLERPDAGNAGDSGDAVDEDAEDVGGDAGDCPGQFARYLQCFLKVGQRSPSQGQGGRGCFGVQVFGPACVSSAVYPTGRVALALRARRHTAQLDLRRPRLVENEHLRPNLTHEGPCRPFRRRVVISRPRYIIHNLSISEAAQSYLEAAPLVRSHEDSRFQHGARRGSPSKVTAWVRQTFVASGHVQIQASKAQIDSNTCQPSNSLQVKP